jgi:hypothetical protein
VILVEDQLAVLSVDGEATGLIKDREGEQRRRLFRRDAHNHVMQDPIADANGVDADEALSVRGPVRNRVLRPFD